MLRLAVQVMVGMSVFCVRVCIYFSDGNLTSGDISGRREVVGAMSSGDVIVDGFKEIGIEGKSRTRSCVCVYVWCYGFLILDEEGDWRYKARGRQVARRSDESDSSRTSRRANRDDFTENG